MINLLCRVAVVQVVGSVTYLSFLQINKKVISNDKIICTKSTCATMEN